MGVIEGTASAEIAAPLDRCWEIAADVDRIHEWQDGVQQIEVLERDGAGRVRLAKIDNDAKVRTISTVVRFDYDPHTGLTWRQEKGDLKSLTGSWSFEAAASGIVHATYRLIGDPGRMLGMLVRGPVEERLRDLLIRARPAELKRRAETG
jgi:hypothetical protein